MNDQTVHIYGERPVRNVQDTDTQWGSLSVRKKMLNVSSLGHHIYIISCIKLMKLILYKTGSYISTVIIMEAISMHSSP